MKKDTGKTKKETAGVCVQCGKAISVDEAIIIDEKIYCKACAEKIKMDEEKPILILTQPS
jgi:DNA-directed RNA polymerase subunit RPC12/RpoP